MNTRPFTSVFTIIFIFFLSYVTSQAQEGNIDHCMDVTQTIIPNKTDPNCGVIQPTFVPGSLKNATPEAIITTCGADQYPTVWFRVKVDADAVQLQTTVTTGATWQPIWAIYYGDCSALTLLDAGVSSPTPIPCSNSDSNPNIHSVGVIQGVDTYWIAVSGMAAIDYPDFTLGVTTLAACVACIGEVGCETQAQWYVTERSSDRALDDPKFCQGEEVKICVTFRYDASDTGVDWFHGLIPDFGPGWDMKDFDGGNIVSNIGFPEWTSMEDTSCAPIIQEQMPYLCTYTDSLSGRLVLCHMYCQSCPCSTPLLAGSILPSGWFWNQPGGAGCDNDCRPSSKYGIGSVVVDINFCVDLKVRAFDKTGDCITNRSLRFNFQTTSDGVTGCWNDATAECKLDFAQLGPAWEIDCNKSPNLSAGISGNAVEICSQESVNLEIFTEDGSPYDIFVTPIANELITGQKDHTFLNGDGIIDDILSNNSDTTQIIYYVARIKDESLTCGIKSDTFPVIVHPNIDIKIAPYISCSDTLVMIPIQPSVSGGTGDLKFLWSTGDTTQNILVTTDTTISYLLTITDQIGCTNVKNAIIQIIKSGESLANLTYNIPSCNETSVDIKIDAASLDPSIDVTFRLLDCAGNQVMNDTIPYMTNDKNGVFEGVDYMSNNCFRLETNISDCITISDSIVISCISSTSDNIRKRISIIPNPTAGLLTIMNDGKQSINYLRIFNALGLASSVEFDTSSQVDISHLTNGVYFLNLQFRDGSQSTHRVILVK